MAPTLLQKWCQFCFKKWCQFGSKIGANLAPKLVPIWLQIWCQPGSEIGSNPAPERVLGLGPICSPIKILGLFLSHRIDFKQLSERPGSGKALKIQVGQRRQISIFSIWALLFVINSQNVMG
jgi:hypothetical protein